MVETTPNAQRPRDVRRNEEIIERLTRVEVQIGSVVTQIQNLATSAAEAGRDNRVQYEQFRNALAEQGAQFQKALIDQRDAARMSRVEDQEAFGKKLTEITSLFVKKADLLWIKTLFMIILPLAISGIWTWFFGHIFF